MSNDYKHYIPKATEEISKYFFKQGIDKVLGYEKSVKYLEAIKIIKTKGISFAIKSRSSIRMRI